MDYSLGLGLTSACNLRCSHCYRDPGPVRSLSLAQVRVVCESIPLRSVNLGTGESALHPEFSSVLDYLFGRALKVSVTSNGHTVLALPDEQLRRFHDVELSLDFAVEGEQDAWRGDGNWRSVKTALERCARLGVQTTVVAVMMSVNHDRLVPVARFAGFHGAPLRVNAYQPVRSDAYRLTFEQYWDGYRALLGATRVVACSEPLLNAILRPLSGPRTGCGVSTIRVTPRAEVKPCVYWPGNGLVIPDLVRLGPAIVDNEVFGASRTLPEACRPCRWKEVCGGGCASRRMLAGRPMEPDEYCPVVRGESMSMEWQFADGADLPKVASSCTLVVDSKD